MKNQKKKNKTKKHVTSQYLRMNSFALYIPKAGEDH